MSDEQFDEVTYWRERHERLRGDHRATGNISRSSEEMRQRKIYQAYYFLALSLKLSTRKRVENTQITVLDIGFGTGFFASLITSEGFDYTGYDISPIAIEDARKVAPLGSFYERNIVETSPAIFDLIFASEVLFHIVDDEKWVTALKNISDAMNKTSVFIFTETFVEQVNDRFPHFRPRTREMYSNAFTKLGLRFATAGDLPIFGLTVFNENKTFITSTHFCIKS